MVTQQHSLQSTTQKYLELFDITNDCLILQDGTVSMVLHSSAINFDLYSEEEQDAAIYAYAALLNSLSFPIEITIRSQRKDVTTYLDLLKIRENKEYNAENKRNIRDYREFVEQLVLQRNVLEKKFYIIISYTALEAGIISGSTFLPGLVKKNIPVLDKHVVLDKALTNLEPRKQHLIHQFARIGLFLTQLKTQELIQLFYTIYNPDSARGIRVSAAEDYATPLVAANIVPQEVAQQHAPPALYTAPAVAPITQTPQSASPQTTPIVVVPPLQTIQENSFPVTNTADPQSLTPPVPPTTPS